MFRRLRKIRLGLDEDACRILLDRATSGVLALLDENGYTYAVPLSYARSGNTLYFHSARAGAKLDAIARHDRVSFAVIAEDTVVPKRFTTYFRSVIVFGRIRQVTDPAETDRGIRALCARYCPDQTPERTDEEIAKEGKHMLVLALDIEHMTGKQAREYADTAQKDG